jgi:hypothetical protein
MGLLEDAIRDHLELKRKHGASAEEVLREEADALGPARREQLYPEQSPAEPALDGPPPEEEAALPHEPASQEPLPTDPAPDADFLEEESEPEAPPPEHRPPRDLDFE